MATLKAIDQRDTLQAAADLHERPLPTLLAWAPGDLMFPVRYAERLAAMIPGARLEPIADSRTFVPEEQPERLAELVSDFAAFGQARPSSSADPLIPTRIAPRTGHEL